MQVGKEHLTLAHEWIFCRDGLFDLDHKFSSAPNILGLCRNLRACIDVILITEARAFSSTCLNQDLVIANYKLMNTGWRHCHATLVVLYFLRNTYKHFLSLIENA